MFLFRPFGLISIGTHLWTEDSVVTDTTLCLIQINSAIRSCISPLLINL